MLGNDTNSVAASADNLLKLVPGASSSDPQGTAAALAKRTPDSDEQMFTAEALADYGLAKKEADRAQALKTVDSAIEILYAFAEKSQLDLTTANNVSLIALAIAPMPWETGAKEVDSLPVVLRAAHLSELAFGKDNPRIFDQLAQLQFHLWNARFGALASELKDSQETQKTGDSGNPLDELQKRAKPTSDDLLQENKDLIGRLYSLAVGEQDAERQEQHLETLANNVAPIEDLSSFLSELLDKRAELVDEAVSRGKLPIAVRYESMIKRAENDLGKNEKRRAALVTIDDVSNKLANLDKSAKRLPRALLAEVQARTTAVKIARAPLNDQMPKADVALKRADTIVRSNSADPGVTVMDLMMATEEFEQLKKPK